MYQFSIYETPRHHQLASLLLPKMRTDSRPVFVIEDSNGIPYTFENELYSTKIPNMGYDPETDHVSQQFYTYHHTWSQTMDSEVVPNFPSLEAARNYLINVFGYANTNHAAQKKRHIKERFIKLTVPVKPTYDSMPLEHLPKRLRARLRHYQQRGLLQELEPSKYSSTFHLRNHRTAAHKQRMLLQSRMAWLRHQGIINVQSEAAWLKGGPGPK